MITPGCDDPSIDYFALGISDNYRGEHIHIFIIAQLFQRRQFVSTIPQGTSPFWFFSMISQAFLR